MWYAGLFLAGTASLFFLAYYLLASAIERKDAEILEAKLKEYVVTKNGRSFALPLARVTASFNALIPPAR